MKKLNILKTVLDFTWYLSILFLLTLLVTLPMYLFGDFGDYIPVEIGNKTIRTNDHYSKLIVLVGVFSGLLFIYSIYLFREVVGYFQKEDLYNDVVIYNFNKIGKLILASTFLTNTVLIAYSFYQHIILRLKGDIKGDSFDFGKDGSFLFSISLGLFFMILSQAFKTAKELKEENDLTV